MTSRLRQKMHTARCVLRHFFCARFWRGFGVHSPYVYHLVRHVICVSVNKGCSAVRLSDDYRRQIRQSDIVVETLQDVGARLVPAQQRRLSDIARRTGIGRKYGHLLGRLAADAQPRGILELGTSTGLSTAYLAAYCPQSVVLSLEWDRVADIAQQLLYDKGMTNVSVIMGLIDNTIESAIASLPSGQVDFAFIDANHTYEATLRYKDIIVAHAAPRCTMVFDDIYWSEGMTQAWQAIVADPRIMTTIELCGMGIAVVRSGCQKEHYVVRC